jgi:hypothetical protein
MFANVRSDGERNAAIAALVLAHAREPGWCVSFVNFVKIRRLIREREAQTARCRTAFCSDREWQVSTHSCH